MRKRKLASAVCAVLLSISMAVPAYADWEVSGIGWKYKMEDGSYATGWNWIDGKSYCFDENGILYADTTTPDGYTVNADGAWVIDGVVQEKEKTDAGEGQSAANDQSSEQYPLKGYIDPEYFDHDPDSDILVWKWNDTYLSISRPDLWNIYKPTEDSPYDCAKVKKAVETGNPFYMMEQSNEYVAAIAVLADLQSSEQYEQNCRKYDIEDCIPMHYALVDAIREFLNSFDWKNASDMEKAVRICNWIQQADYDYEITAPGVKATEKFKSYSYGAYGCLVDKKAVCQGYVGAAKLLGFCVGLPVFTLGTAFHAYPVFLVDGVWLSNEPTSKARYLMLADVYALNPGGYGYQRLGDYCAGVGYEIPEDLSQFGVLWRELSQIWYFGRYETVIDLNNVLNYHCKYKGPGEA